MKDFPKKDFIDERDCQEYYEQTLFPMCGIFTTVDMNTDGRFQGNLFEFKYPLKSLSKALLQSIKYLSNFRIRGVEVPSVIYILDGKNAKAYKYNSEQFHSEIQKIYNGSASKDNDKFYKTITPDGVYSLEDDSIREKFVSEVKANKIYHKIDIDENCILGWAARYYRENLTATKDDFLKNDGELRKPDKFKDFVNPYIGRTNEKFKYIMDVLNDKAKKKKLGAFYTPSLYCKKAAELVREAISKVPEGYDYIILDRCAGSGNLEASLNDEELSHCILNTLEYYEYLVLKERLGSRARAILPVDINGNDIEVEIDENGLIKENDALSQEFIENKYIKKYIDNEKCVVIMYENPPYSEETTNASGSSGAGKQMSFVLDEMKNDKTLNSGRITNELANRFIWSAWKYYLKGEADKYIIFSPMKYWKIYNICDKKLENGFIFNRKYFHATPAAIGCCLWKNKPSTDKSIQLEICDINDNILKILGNITIKKCEKILSFLYDKRVDKDDVPGTLWCSKDGYENSTNNISVPSKYNKNIIASIEADAFQNNQIAVKLLTGRVYNGHDFYVRNDNYLNKIVLFVTKISYAYRENYYDDLFYSSSDGGTKYEQDNEFLKSCLIYTCLCQHNKCLSFKGSDNKNYFNELCFDIKSTHKSQALIDLNSMILNKDGTQNPLDPKTTESITKVNNDGTKKLKFSPFKLNDDEEKLFEIWNNILEQIVAMPKYNKNYSYGLYQIIQEINTFHYDDEGNRIPDNIALNDYINTLKTKLKDYYKLYIEPKCFEYELLK